MFGLLVLVGLFVALTPGVLFRLKGSKKMSAAMHAVLFGVVVYVVSTYFISFEGFQAGPSPCPPGSTVSLGLLSRVCIIDEKPAMVVRSNATGKESCSKGTIFRNGSCYGCNSPYIAISGSVINEVKCRHSVPLKCPEPYALSLGGNCIIPVVDQPITYNGKTFALGSRVACTIKSAYGPRQTFNGIITNIRTTFNMVTVTQDNGTVSTNVGIGSCSLLEGEPMPMPAGPGRVEGPVHTPTNPWGATQSMGMNAPDPGPLTRLI
jgi:hypothetical protein